MTVSNDEDWDNDTYDRAQAHCETFFEEVFAELANYGEIEDLVIVDNVGDHMLGNVYVRYFLEDAAEKALKGLDKRFYGSKLIQVEYSPVSDFREARCKAFHETRCTRGGCCNFMHIKHIPKTIKRRMVREMYEDHPQYQNKATNADQRNNEPKRRKTKRMSSEERKAMIAEWNKSRFSGVQPPPPSVPPPPAVSAGLIGVAPPPPASVVAVG